MPTAAPPKEKESLKDVAEREADEAEQELEEQGGDVQLHTSEPGEQGIATQDEDEDQEEAEPFERNPTEQDTKVADELYGRLATEAHKMGAEEAIDALVRVVDVHPSFTLPGLWPGKADEALAEAPFLEKIGKVLCKACPKIEISIGQVRFLWKNQKSWTKKGVAIRAQGKTLSREAQFYADARAVVTGNWQLFRLMNTRQKLAAVYGALRRLDTDGNVQPNQFEGFFDEIELFGTGTFQTDALLARAIEHGAQRELPFEEKPDEFTAAEATDPEQPPAQEAAAD